MSNLPNNNNKEKSSDSPMEKIEKLTLSSLEALDQLDGGQKKDKRTSKAETKEIFDELEITIAALLKNITARRSAIEAVLEKETFKPEWEMVRKLCVQFDVNGNLLTNPVIADMYSQAEPIIHRFQDDLSNVRIGVSNMLSMLDKNEYIHEHPSESWNSPAAQFLTILKIVSNMSTWAVEIQNTWVTYHVTREQLGDDPYLLKVADPEENLDRGRALAAWDGKMAGESRSVVNTLLYNYIALEDILHKAGHYLFVKTEQSVFMKLYS